MSAPSVACKKHRHTPVKGYSPCAGCEVERLTKERNAALAVLAASDQALIESRVNEAAATRMLAEAQEELSTLKGKQVPVGHVYTMHPCFPGEPKRAHAQLHVALPAGTKLYTAPPALASAWVSVENRLPEDEDPVWCYGIREGESELVGFEGYYSVERCRWHAADYGETVGMMWRRYAAEVTHWQPLPVAPGAEVKS